MASRVWLVALVVLLPTSACAQTTVLPNGTYVYAMYDSGTNVGSSTITVGRSGGDVAISEHASPMEDGETTRRILDGTTFATNSYADDNSGKTVLSVTIDGSVATLHNAVGTQTFTAPAGNRFVIFDGGVAAFFHLPAMLRADPSPVSMLSILFANKLAPVVPSGAPGPRPPGVPSNAVAIALKDEGATGTLWYDPQTRILQEFDFPSHGIAFKLVSTR
jgi:hypothetical protein